MLEAAFPKVLVLPKTTFTPLSGDRYRCNRDGCKTVVGRESLDRHRQMHYGRDRPKPKDEPVQSVRHRPEVTVLYSLSRYYWICWKHDCDERNPASQVGNATCRACGTKVKVVDKNGILPTPEPVWHRVRRVRA